MTGQRLALVLAADHYDNAGLRDLAPSGVDTRALLDVLSSPGLGGFTVEYLRDPDSQNAFVKVHDLLADRKRADVVLLYVIGQGMTGPDGQLYLAASDTDPDRLADTAIGSSWIARVMARSRADHVVMVLDCQWRLDNGTADLSDHFQPDEVDDGQSRAVICRRPSSGSRDLARAIVSGLRTGEADRSGNGYITVDELYDYIRDESSAQGWETGSPGQPYVSRSPARRGGDVTDRLGDPRASIRLSAVRSLGQVAAGADLDRAADARHSLGRAAEDQDETVALAALDELDRTALRLPGGVVDFGTVSPATPRLAEDVHIEGPPLARASTVAVSGRGLRAWISGSLLHIAWTPTGERLDGTVTLSGPAGDAKVQVVGEIRAGVPAAAGAAARRRALDDLGALRDTTTRLTPPPGPPPRTFQPSRLPLSGGPAQPPAGRRRLLLIFAGVLVLLVLSGVGIRALIDRKGNDAGAPVNQADTRIGTAPSRPGPAQVPPSTAKPTVVGTWKVGAEPEGVAISPDSTTIYVANQKSKIMSVIDTATGAVRSLTLPTQPHFVTMSNDGKRVYASLYDDLFQNSGVAVIDTADDHLERVAPTGTQPYDIGVAPDGRIWVPIHSAHRVEVYTADGSRRDAVIQVPANPHSVGFSPDGTFAYTPNHESDEVTMINARANQVQQRVKVGKSPHNLTVSPDGGQILVAEFNADMIELLDTTNLAKLFQTKVGKEPQCVAFAADGRHGYVVNEGSNTMSVIDVSNGKVTATIGVGVSPRAVVTSPDGKFAYVTNGGSNTVTVLKVS
jgi:YVTN family beta-propeller protein